MCSCNFAHKILKCTNCKAFWCFGCTFKTYFGKIETADQITIIRTNRCAKCIVCTDCQKFFDETGVEAPKQARHWGNQIGKDDIGSTWVTHTGKVNISSVES